MFRVYLKTQLKYDEMQRISPMREKGCRKITLTQGRMYKLHRIVFICQNMLCYSSTKLMPICHTAYENIY